MGVLADFDNCIVQQCPYDLSASEIPMVIVPPVRLLPWILILPGGVQRFYSGPYDYKNLGMGQLVIFN